MKTKIRSIEVESHTFRWRVAPIDSNYICLRIWKTDQRRIPWTQVRCRFDDPWLHFGEIISGDPERIKKYFQLNPIKPGLVRELILRIVQKSGWSDQIENVGNFELNVKGDLVQIEDATVSGTNPFSL